MATTKTGKKCFRTRQQQPPSQVAAMRQGCHLPLSAAPPRATGRLVPEIDGSPVDSRFASLALQHSQVENPVSQPQAPPLRRSYPRRSRHRSAFLYLSAGGWVTNCGPPFPFWRPSQLPAMMYLGDRWNYLGDRSLEYCSLHPSTRMTKYLQGHLRFELYCSPRNPTVSRRGSPSDPSSTACLQLAESGCASGSSPTKAHLKWLRGMAKPKQ